MRTWLLRTVLVLTLGATAASLLSRSEEKKPDVPLTLQEQNSELARLREVFASVKKLPEGARWVEVQAGPAGEKTWHKGWLIRESKTEVQLLTEDGSCETLNKRKLAAGRPPAEFSRSDVWAVRAGDYDKFCREFMARKKEATNDPNEPGVYRFNRERSAAESAVLDSARLACWASATGKDDLSRELLKRAAEKLRAVSSTYGGYTYETKLHQFVARRTAPDLQDGADALEDDRNPRDSRLRTLRWNRALAKIPYRPDHDAILRTVKQLESLTAEDKAWKEPTKDELARMDVKQKAVYWLYHLRDLNVEQSASPGMCMVLTDSPWAAFQSHQRDRDAPNPAVELKKLGYEALPHIIAHLDDDRPTRCVGFWRFYAPDSYYTLTYGDCCQQIFEAIVLHPIYERASTSGYPLRDGKGKQCKERAEKWWKEFQKKGEKRMLIEATARGVRVSDDNAERLVARYPEAAFEPLRDGIRSAKEDWIRSNMLNCIRQLKDERVVAFLAEEAKGPHLYARVNAVEGLLERGREEGVALLVAEWSKLDFDKVDSFHSNGAERLLAALARCGSDKAIAALAARWKTTPLDWRHRTLDQLVQADKDFAKKPFTPTANRAVEDFLISCLGERAERHRRRTCDLAANALAVRWGEPKLFDLAAPLSVRNRRIVEVQNVWRKNRAMDPLPVPEARKVPAVADAAVTPSLKTVVGPSAAEAQRDAATVVERLGLGALPRVSKELVSLPKDHPARHRLSKLAGRLACIVGEVRFSDDSVARPDAMRKAAESLKNRPLSEEAFVELLVAIQRHAPEVSGGIVVALDRDGDGTGIQLEIRVLPRCDPAEGESVHLRRTQEVAVDGHELLCSTSATVGIGKETPSEWDSGDWKELRSSLRNAMEAPPDKQFQVRVEVTRGR
jgi:hypothetical protein